MALGDLPFWGQIGKEIHELAWFLGFLICFLGHLAAFFFSSGGRASWEREGER